MSSASKHVLHEALLWGAAALAGFGLFYFFDDISARAGTWRRDRRAIVARQEKRDEAARLRARGAAQSRRARAFHLRCGDQRSAGELHGRYRRHARGADL